MHDKTANLASAGVPPRSPSEARLQTPGWNPRDLGPMEDRGAIGSSYRIFEH